VASVEWRHDIDLPGEGRTVGFYDPAHDLDRTGVPKRLDGERVLDVGCSDGGHTFLCEERGASVLGIDDQSSPRNEGRNNFEYTKERLGASAEYRQGRVSDLVAAGESPFDRILHLNVLYHVEDLLGEARALHSLLVPGGSLHLKTKFLTAVPSRLTSRVPTSMWLRQQPKIGFVEEGIAGDLTCYFVPSATALLALLRRAGFAEATLTAVHQDRAYVKATA
jgi:SAM-dependent methyltransferase